MRDKPSASGKAVIVGGGPAGLTAAWEFLDRTAVVPLVLEMTDQVGGISKTVRYKGNRIDIGGHRFFSKSNRVMEWWLSFMPLEAQREKSARLTYQNQSRTLETSGEADPDTTDRVMLLRQRKSRIYYRRSFFDYPVSPSLTTFRNLGLKSTLKIAFSYGWSMIFPYRKPKNLDQFLIDRFGTELYSTFVEDSTEKVWGVPCREISPEWGAQRIKGLSIAKAARHFLQSLLPQRASDVAQKETETSLIERFLYPKFGPGQMWEIVAEEVDSLGGEVRMNSRVMGFHLEGNRVVAVETEETNGARRRVDGDYFISSMPIPHLVRALGEKVPVAIREIAKGLVFRDFLTVGLLVDRLTITEPDGSMVRDNWIYIQEPEVSVGRLQIFNNWSPYMVADPGKVWIGLEYFCDAGDDIWSRSDDELKEFGAQELEKIGILHQADVVDGVVVRMPKTYPAYFGSYNRFGELRAWLDSIENLFLVGRNGMHRYNNQDHSMLTAMKAVDNVAQGNLEKESLWSVNVEQEYHEEK